MLKYLPGNTGDVAAGCCGSSSALAIVSTSMRTARPAVATPQQHTGARELLTLDGPAAPMTPEEPKVGPKVPAVASHRATPPLRTQLSSVASRDDCLKPATRDGQHDPHPCPGGCPCTCW